MSVRELSDAHNHAHELGDASDFPRCIANGTSPRDWRQVAEFAAARPGLVTASFGLHPWFIEGTPDSWSGDLRRRLEADPEAGVGECGLDKTRRSPAMALQNAVFCEQLAIAREFDRLLSVHCVRAWGSLLEILRDEELPPRGVLLHSFGAPVEMVREFLPLEGVRFSLCFAGHVVPTPELVRALPVDRMLVESDANLENGRDPTQVVTDGLCALAEMLEEPAERLAMQLGSNLDQLLSPAAG